MEVTYLTHASQLNDIGPHVMAIGFFDGVHLGHQELFDQAKKHAARLGVKSSAMTFSPHPDEVIKGDINRKYITPLDEKIKKISQCGIDSLFVMEFDKEFASLPPALFIEKYIHGMKTKHVVVGFDFTFGRKAAGNTDFLEQESVKSNFGLTVVPKKTYLNTKISSTETRKLVLSGDVDLIPHYLGEHYKIKVTANDITLRKNMVTTHIRDRYILPKPGQYEVKVISGHHVYDGEFVIDPDSENDLLICNLNNLNENELTVVFLNRLRVRDAILV